MKSLPLSQCAAAFVALLSFTTTLRASVAIPVSNAGFENPAVAEGFFPTTITGWSQGKYDVTAPTVWIPGASGAGYYNVSINEYTSGAAPEGSNMAYTTAAPGFDTGINQVLTATLQADASYSLSVKVGNPFVLNGAPTADYRIELLAGGVVLASSTAASPADDTTTATAILTHNSGAAPAQLGQPLEIRLLAKDFGGALKLDFDDVQLTATHAQPAAAPGGPYSVPAAGSLALNGSGSFPSEGQNITAYEWDVNNDGIFGDVTGVTPAPIPFTALFATWGMEVGSNTIGLRVTDDSSPTPKTSTAFGTVTLAAPLGCQLGVLNLTANGGINPNTGLPWAAGDKYRIAFHTDGTTITTSNNPDYYNDFATAEAWTVPALQGTYWRAMVTVNLDPTTTQALSPKREVKANTGTGDLTGGSNQGGAGEPVYVTNGTTCIARNNADIWNAWSNPFENSLGVPNTSGTGNNTTRFTGGFYSPYLTQNGVQTTTPDANHGRDVATGCNFDGSHVNALGDTTDTPDNINRGSTNANTTGRIWNRFTDTTVTARSLYVISVPLTVVDLSETVKPTLVSFVDNRSGADLALGTGSIVYTVTFSESIDASTITAADFENGGTATVSIDSIRGSLNPAAFDVTVTPTTGGTVVLQSKIGAVIEDPVGNTLDATAAIADDTTINVISDITAPTLVSMGDSVSGGPIIAFNAVTYTVTFDEAINASTVNIADFGNGGTAPITVNSVAPTGNPAVFTVTVTPTGAGSLTLGILAGATITDLIGNPLVTTSALPDDTTITIGPDPLPTLISITDNQSGGPVFATQSFTYMVTFSQVINPVTLDVSDFENGGTPAISVNDVARTSNPAVFAVHVTPGGAGTLTLQIKTGAVITNVNGTALDTTSALPDDATLSVNAGSGPARGTITFNGPATFTSANLATLTRTFDASASDKLVVIVTGENGNPGDLSGNSTLVTYDGTPLSKVIDRNPIGGNPFDQTFNDIWYLDNPGLVHTTGAISASVNTRGSITVFGLSGTAPGVGQTAISPQASKSVVLSTGFANSIVIASHGMGGDGNSANVTAVDAVLPLIETSATAQVGGSGPLPSDGHVTAYALVPASSTATYSFTGGSLVGSHTIAAEFLAASPNPYATWTAGPFATTLSNTSADFDFDNGGLQTGIEWVVGGDPTLSGDDAGNSPAFDNSNPANFEFVFKRRDAAAADPSTAIVVEYGSDLAGWRNTATHGVADGVSVDDTTDLGGGFHEVTVSIPRTLAVDGSLFARLKVTVTLP